MLKAGLFVLALLIAGCESEGRDVTLDKNHGGYQVKALFEIDGCTVYRFMDGTSRYFTNCRGSVQWREHCGKGCSRHQSVPTE